jgi:hypothetical protein
MGCYRKINWLTRDLLESEYVEQAAECFYASIDTPLKLGRVPVLNAEDFVKGHLKVLAAKLRGDDGWLYEQWPLASLLADLKDIGVELQILERQ